jgi:predicted transposase/invertase (TIGR01784 family)
MRHRIDPKVDCVFKALLGAEGNRGLLIHFLNAVLGADLPQPITTVEIKNPYNEKEFIGDKLSIVDIKARDAFGCLYQVELQLLTHRDLIARIIYGWADLYSSLLSEGQEYGKLRPTYAIWLLGEVLLADDPNYAHDIRLRDAAGRVFGEHGGIRLLEIAKFASEAVETEQERWVKFFKEGAKLDPDHLPPWMDTPEMRQAMSTLNSFSEKENAYYAYQARLEYQRVQRAMQQDMEERDRAIEERDRALEERDRASWRNATAPWRNATVPWRSASRALEQTRAELEQSRAAETHERDAKERALAEVERLRRQLNGQ